jgi:predicted enzyme related to lactoylglutathione lyase
MNKLIAATAALLLAGSVPAAAQPVAPIGLYAVKIAVTDYARAIRFYSLLGMAAGTKYNASEWELRWVDPARGAVFIMVRDETGRFGVTKGGGFVVLSVADVAASGARLKAAGFTVAGEPHATQQGVFWVIKDPDGNSVELVGPAPAKAP